MYMWSGVTMIVNANSPKPAVLRVGRHSKEPVERLLSAIAINGTPACPRLGWAEPLEIDPERRFRGTNSRVGSVRDPKCTVPLVRSAIVSAALVARVDDRPTVPTAVLTPESEEKRVATKLLQPVDFIGGVDGTSAIETAKSP